MAGASRLVEHLKNKPLSAAFPKASLQLWVEPERKKGEGKKKTFKKINNWDT